MWYKVDVLKNDCDEEGQYFSKHDIYKVVMNLVPNRISYSDLLFAI